MKKYYLAYGSNLNKAQMRLRCPGASYVGKGVLSNYELLFKGSKTGAYLTIEKKEGCKVPVGIWEVTEADEKRLDRYEGYPNFYYKEEEELDKKGSKLKAFIYIMHEEREFAVPTMNYFRTCLQGYEDFGFDKKYLYEALYKSADRRKDNGR